MKHIAIIGAGIAGLTCAYELQKKGHTVTVYEKEPYVGGRMSTRWKDGFPFDIGANHFINLYTEMRAYCDELGIEWERFVFVNYKIFKHGKLQSIADTLTAKDKLNLAKAYLKYKKFPTTFLDSSTLAEYDDGDAYSVAKEEVGESFADNVVDTYVGVYQFHRASEASKAGLYSQLNSTKSFTKEWYLHRTQGGKIAIPEAMAKTLDVHVNTPVDRIEATDTGVTVTVAGEETQFDLAVLATTATTATKIYSNPTPGQLAVMKQAKYASSIVVAFTMPADTFGSTTGEHGTVSAVWVPYSESTLISSYSNESEKGEELVRDGKTLLLVFFREDGADAYMNKSDEDIYTIAKEEFLRCCPLVSDASTIEAHDLYRWDEAMPKFYAGSLKAVKHFLDTDQGKNNVWFAGDYLNAPWTEGAMRMGQRVAGAIDAEEL